MIDLKKIDFSRLTLPDWSGETIKFDGDALLRGERSTIATLDWCSRVWFYVSGTWTDLVVARTYTDRVDAFIVAESARLAVGDEAANFVPVPWQDVMFLNDSGIEVKWVDPLGKQRGSVMRGLHWVSCANKYRADRRTLPAGYDPEKPRWVEVDDDDWCRLRKLGVHGQSTYVRSFIDAHTLPPGVPLHVEPEKPRWVEVSYQESERLLSLGCSRAIAVCGRDWREDLAWAPGALCAIDIHTLPPGVPLHVEQPKPEPRPCTREFALAHPLDSEYRERIHDGRQHLWSDWFKVEGARISRMDKYEFRTTAREPEKRRVTVEFDGKRWAGELTEQ